jgi:hypothetical protein
VRGEIKTCCSCKHFYCAIDNAWCEHPELEGCFMINKGYVCDAWESNAIGETK